MSSEGLLKNDSVGQIGRKITIGLLGEKPEERRVSMVPEVAKNLIKDGYAVCVEQGAGIKSGFADKAYANVGCTVCERQEVVSKSDVLLAIDAPVDEFESLGSKVLISWVSRRLPQGKEITAAAAKANITLMDLTAVPRITIAQKLDVLSSQAKVAGHRAVVEATHVFGRFHSGEMTAAGKYPPSRTFVLGCGVAGLAAIGTAKALGSEVRAWDVRDVSDQVKSMGGKWVTVDFKESGEGSGGYAKESSEAFQKAQRETFAKHLKEVDIVITTAAIPGRKSPLLVTKEMVADMKPGSVIVDLAAQGGGNCELTKQGEVFETDNGVTIVGYTDLPARMSNQASAMYAQNVQNLLRHIHNKAGADRLLAEMELHLAMSAEEASDWEYVTQSVVCTRKGEQLKEPPQRNPTAPKKPASKKAAAKKPRDPQWDGIVAAVLLGLMILAIFGLGEGVPASLLTTFVLAGAAGYQAVWGVAHALHSPLMAVTNAISGMTAVGGLLLYDKVTDPAAKTLAMIATGFSAVNIIGGFVVSQRLLNTFNKGKGTEYSPFLLLCGLVLVYGACQPGMMRAVNTASALLCIMAIGGLASMTTANSGCKFGMLGVLGALATTFRSLSEESLGASLFLMAIGGSVGLAVSIKVTADDLPQTVAAFHSFVGLAAMCTSIGSFYENPVAELSMHNTAAILGDFIGGVTLTGSLVAFLKLKGWIFGKKVPTSALSLPGKNFINLGSLIFFIVCCVLFMTEGNDEYGVLILWVVAVLSLLMGLHLVASVGGGDMPVCITVLNSYSGWALVAEGFLLKSPVLTIVGSLIGFSGAILTKIMCDGMNRDIFNVIFGGYASAPAVKGDTGPKEHRETNSDAVAQLLADASDVLVVPGYGMAQARAQNAFGGLASKLREADISVKFGIHPVAGRMPGQMNVLLAEAGVPYEWVHEMDEVNPDMDKVDVVICAGCNDIVNSASQEIEGCSIWGMPVIEVWRAKKVIFMKRTMGGGYADLENPVFFKENTDMLLGDAKKMGEELTGKVEQFLAGRGSV